MPAALGCLRTLLRQDPQTYFSQKNNIKPKNIRSPGKIKNRHYNDSLCGKIVEWVVKRRKSLQILYILYINQNNTPKKEYKKI